MENERLNHRRKQPRALRHADTYHGGESVAQRWKLNEVRHDISVHPSDPGRTEQVVDGDHRLVGRVDSL